MIMTPVIWVRDRDLSISLTLCCSFKDMPNLDVCTAGERSKAAESILYWMVLLVSSL